jgi:transcriptional regulator with XRE-family HTH domain
VTIRAGNKLTTLLKRVKRAAQPLGKKTALAKALGVTPTRISNWLSGDRAPNGEITLLMLEWVQAEEANQTKSSRSVEAPQEPKTQLRNPKHEIQKPGRKNR